MTDAPRQTARPEGIESGTVRAGGLEFGCDVLNISECGARIRARRPLVAGTPVALGIGGRGDVAGEVVWRRSGVMGIAFQATGAPAPSGAPAPAVAPGPAVPAVPSVPVVPAVPGAPSGQAGAAGPREKRRYTRRPVLWPGRVFAADSSFDCRVTNVSVGGARIRGGAAMPDDAPVTLTIDWFERFQSFPAKLAWRTADAAGLDFAQHVDAVAQAVGGLLGHFPHGLRPDGTAADARPAAYAA